MQKSTNVYKDILIISTGFVLLHFVWKNPVAKQVFFYTGLGIAVVSLLSPFIAEKIVWGWLKLAHILGYINSRIILSAIFFVFLTPVALLYRMRKGDPLRLKKSGGSYYTARNHSFEKKDLEKMW